MHLAPGNPKLHLSEKLVEQLSQANHDGNPNAEKSHWNGQKRLLLEIELVSPITSLALSRASLLQSQAYTVMLSRPLQEKVQKLSKN